MKIEDFQEFWKSLISITYGVPSRSLLAKTVEAIVVVGIFVFTKL